MYCPVYGCSSDSQKNPSGISFFSFPSGKSVVQQRRRKVWIEFCKRKEFNPSSCSRICSRHFTEDAYEPGHSPQFLDRIECKEAFHIRLKSDALPTLNHCLKQALKQTKSFNKKKTARKGESNFRSINSFYTYYLYNTAYCTRMPYNIPVLFRKVTVRNNLLKKNTIAGT